MAKHALLAPSAAERWIMCPASVELSKYVPESTSVYAEEGTLAHALAAQKLEKLIGNKTLPEYINKLRKDELYTKDIDDYTDVYVREIKKRQERYTRPITIIENRLDLSFIAPETYGTADCILLDDETIEVIDFKYGKNVKVSAVNNPQLRLYALGAINRFDGLIADIKTVTTTIIQPRMANISSETLTKEELTKWLGETVRPKAAEALKGGSEPAPGDWCKFCPAKAICKNYSTRNNPKVLPKDPRILTYSEIGQLIADLESTTSYLKTLKDFALTEALDGKDIPGFKVVEGRSTRKWVNTDEVIERSKEVGVDPVIKEIMTPPKLEKQLGKKQFKELFEDLVIKPQGKPTLVTIADKRAPYNSAENDFKGIEI